MGVWTGGKFGSIWSTRHTVSKCGPPKGPLTTVVFVLGLWGNPTVHYLDLPYNWYLLVCEVFNYNNIIPVTPTNLTAHQVGDPGVYIESKRLYWFALKGGGSIFPAQVLIHFCPIQLGGKQNKIVYISCWKCLFPLENMTTIIFTMV